jgi:hypothetical protein
MWGNSPLTSPSRFTPPIARSTNSPGGSHLQIIFNLRNVRRGTARGFAPCARRARLRIPSGARRHTRKRGDWCVRRRESGANRRYWRIDRGCGVARDAAGFAIRRLLRPGSWVNYSNSLDMSWRGRFHQRHEASRIIASSIWPCAFAI